MDITFCPFCRGTIEAGGDSFCICNDLEDARDIREEMDSREETEDV